MRTVVGVIADMKDQAINRPSFPTVYAPYAQYHNEGWGINVFAVRTGGDPLAAISMVRDQIHALMPNIPVAEVASMEQLLARSLSRARFSMLLLSIFAALALVLAAVGIYGVMAYAVAQRTREIGVRLALGAQPRDVLKHGAGGRRQARCFRTGSRSYRFAGHELFSAQPALRRQLERSLTYATVAVLLGVVALAACYLPARRATRVDPLVALRYE